MTRRDYWIATAKALENHDIEAVEAILLAFAIADPRGANDLYNVLKLASQMGLENHELDYKAGH